MRCLTNYARTHAQLDVALRLQAADQGGQPQGGRHPPLRRIQPRACGREFTYWLKHFGYIGGGCWTAAENIAWGTGRARQRPRDLPRLAALARAPRDILGPYTELGIGLRSGRLEGHRGAHVWVQELGSHECS